MAINIMAAFEQEPQPLDFLWSGFLAGTVGALVSPGGVGKSFFALEAAIAVAGGPDLLGLQPQHTGRVLYLAAEDPELILVHRLHAIGKYLSRDEREAVAEKLIVEPIVGSRLDLLKDAHLRRVIEACADVRLLILDTLGRLHTGDENSNGDMARLVGVLEHVSAKTGVSVLYLHHISKGAALSGQGDQQQAARGASALIDNARWCGYLCRMTKEEARTLTDRVFDREPIGEERRGFYLRFGVSKSNYAPPTPDRWLVREQSGVLRAVELRPAEKEKAKGGDNGDRPRL